VGKSAVVEGLALRVAEGDVPDSLKEIEIRTLDLGLLQAGAGVKGEFENRLKSVIQEVREAPKPTILFIDEAHTLIGAGGSAGTNDAANLLKPALARGELRTIAATTWSEYKKYIEKDPALERRFQMVKIDEPSVEDAAVMLRGIKLKYEEHHSVQITNEAIYAAARLSERFVAGRQLPDKAVDLMDTALARVKMTKSAKPAVLDDIERRLLNLSIESKASRHDLDTGLSHDEDAFDALQEMQLQLETEKSVLEERWKKERDLARSVENLRRRVAAARAAGNGQAADEQSGDGMAAEGLPDKSLAAEGLTDEGLPADSEFVSIENLREELRAVQARLAEVQENDAMVHAEVNEEVVAQVIADWTGIPVGDMLKDEAVVLLDLENRLTRAIKGQDEPIGEIADSIRASKAGMGNPDAPLAVFLLVGPSGVGKTETARMLAEMLFGGDRFLVTINMSEYQESHTVSQLKGSPPGYVGYGEGGVLTEAVRQRPYSVVLLDETEKAHLDVMELFYQVFDKGFMRDGEGREIDFRNTIIMMTSNIGSDIFLDVCTEDERPTPDQLREVIHQQLVHHFQAALLARMKVVPYYPLRADAMKEITRLKLNKIDQRLRSSHGMRFVFGEEVVDRIAERCTQVDSGARNIDFIIDRTLLPEASKALLVKMTEEEMPKQLVLGIDENGDFTYTFDVSAPIVQDPA
jgi:type VI secretion system protein VasG